MDIATIKEEIDKRTITKKERAIELRDKIIDKLPVMIRSFIQEAFIYQRIPQEYLLSSLLNAFGNAIGSRVKLEALGYTNSPNIYSVIVGSRGDTKSLAISLALKPILKLDNDKYDMYKQVEAENETLPDNEKVILRREQILISDATIEAALKIHNENPISIGLYKDEISGLIDNMSNPNSRDGSQWLMLFLEGFTNGTVIISRKTTDSYRINKACPLLIGSIQNQLVYKIFEKGKLESGFVDRLLFTVKLEGNDKVSKENISEDVLYGYNNLIDKVLKLRYKEPFTDPVILHLDKEAEDLLFDYSQSLIYRKKDFKTPVKEYLDKLNINVYKLIIIIHSILSISAYEGIPDKVPKTAVQLAIDITEFYLLNFEILLELNPVNDADATLSAVINYAKQNDLTQKEVSIFTKKDKSTISRNWKK